MKSRVQIVVKGLNQERAFNNLAKKVQILKLDREDKHICRIEVRPKDLKTASDFLSKNNFEILKISSFGWHEKSRRFFSCYGIIAGLVLSFASFFAQKGVVWQIKVEGEHFLSEKEIVSFINDNLQSRWITNIDSQKLEIALKDNFERISSVSVAVIGQTLVVNLVEAVIPEEMSDFNSIVSNYDCRITDIELIQGTLNVKVGDIVRAGEEVVLPFIIDAEGKQRPVKPMAKIKAEAWLEGKSEHNESYYKTYRTGKMVETSKIKLFGLDIYSNSKQLPFKQYEVEKSTENLTKNNILPLKIEKTRYFETKTELIESSFEEKKEEFIDLARQNALQKASTYEIIKSEHYTLKSVGGITTVTYIITIECEIGGVT